MTVRFVGRMIHSASVLYSSPLPGSPQTSTRSLVAGLARAIFFFFCFLFSQTNQWSVAVVGGKMWETRDAEKGSPQERRERFPHLSTCLSWWHIQ